MLVNAIVDPELLIRQYEDLPSTTDDESRGRYQLESERPFAQQLPFLSENCEALCHLMSLAPAAPWAVWNRLAAHELIPMLTAVLREPLRRSVEGEIHILSSGVSEGVFAPGFITLLQNAVVGRGWTIHLGVPCAVSRAGASDAAERVLAALRTEITSPRLRLQVLLGPPPAPAVVIENLVFIAAQDWLSSLLNRGSERANFGVAIDSKELAESLRACFTGASDL
jgi:hypothetical protein